MINLYLFNKYTKEIENTLFYVMQHIDKTSRSHNLLYINILQIQHVLALTRTRLFLQNICIPLHT